MSSRREFVRFLAASPLFGALAAIPKALSQESSLATAADALDVFDFEAAARSILPPAHWGYMATGVDGEETSLTFFYKL